MEVPPVPSPGAEDRRVQVEILRWPEDGPRRDALRAEGRPRLLLLEPGTPPPPPDPLEDWVWSPIDERDLSSRLRRLSARRPDPPVDPDVTVDPDGVLRAGGRILPLPAVEAALLRRLSTPPIAVRSREDLARAAWGRQPRARRSLDSRVLSLRRRVAPLGLGIACLRGEGFLLVVNRRAEEQGA